MNYITTTDLRTKSASLVASLQKGESINLIHRSKIVGVIKPAQKTKTFNITAFRKSIKGLQLDKTSYREREKIYRKHIMEKYGKGLS